MELLIDSRRKRLKAENTSHSHNHLSILYVVSGHGLLEISGKQFEVVPNTIIVLTKNLAHKLTDKPRKTMTAFSLYLDIETSKTSSIYYSYRAYRRCCI
jgi:quercetin dioxygenase-like cupin family protein